jgi:hypothetical protein
VDNLVCRQIGSLSALSLLPIMARPKKIEVERDGDEFTATLRA